MNFLWIFKVWCPIGPKQSQDYLKLAKSVSIMVILPPIAITTFSNMDTRFLDMAMTQRNKKMTFYTKFILERCKCLMIVTNTSMTISQGINFGHKSN